MFIRLKNSFAVKAGVGLILSWATISMGIADQIYKTVDEDGNVSYSSEPTASGETSETLKTLPEPDEEDVVAARQRQQKIEQQLKEQSEARAEQAEREARYNPPGQSTIVINTNPLVVPGAFHHPRHHHRRQRNRSHRADPHK